MYLRIIAQIIDHFTAEVLTSAVRYKIIHDQMSSRFQILPYADPRINLKLSALIGTDRAVLFWVLRGDKRIERFGCEFGTQGREEGKPLYEFGG